MLMALGEEISTVDFLIVSSESKNTYTRMFAQNGEMLADI